MQHDACGVGFVARVAGDPGHDIVRHGLTALVRLAHRGAPASLGAVDGCGVLTAIPWAVVLKSLRGAPPAGRTRALGMLFVHPADADRATALIERELRALGAAFAWRTVPTDRAAVLKAQRASTPRVLQLVIGMADARHTASERLYRARLRMESTARAAGLRLTVVSLSTATVVYKALTTPEALPVFYPDLTDEAFASRFVVFHQRFSTNTSADWALAQPFRVLAHNGEINTIAGNREWMRARLLDATSLPGFAKEEPIARDGSDSRTLDEAVELLRHRGYPVAHALSRLMPPAWERDRDLAPDVRAFHEFQSLASEPWDGPSALAFADGRFVGAALDRNGFRPARVVRTAANLIAVASETGILAASEHEIVERDRLGPGDMLMVDLQRGAIMRTNEIHRRLAFRHRYRHLVENTLRTLPEAANLANLPNLPNLANLANLANPANPVNLANPANPANLNLVNLEPREPREPRSWCDSRRDRGPPQADDFGCARGGRIDGGRYAAGGTVVALTLVHRLLPPALCASDEPTGGSVPRIERHVADDLYRWAGVFSRRDGATASASRAAIARPDARTAGAARIGIRARANHDLHDLRRR